MIWIDHQSYFSIVIKLLNFDSTYLDQRSYLCPTQQVNRNISGTRDHTIKQDQFICSKAQQKRTRGRLDMI